MFEVGSVVSVLISIAFVKVIIEQHLFIAILVHVDMFLLHHCILVSVVIVSSSNISSLWHLEVVCILLLLVKLAHDFLSLKIGMEVNDLLSHIKDHVDLIDKHLVQVADVLLHITAWLIHLIEESHLVFD